MALPDHATVVVSRQSEDGGKSYNVLHYTVPDDISVVTGDDAANRLAVQADLALKTGFLPLTAEGCRYNGVAVRITTGGHSYDSAFYGNAAAGTVAGDSCPNFVAGVIKKRTTNSSKSGQGRFFIGCLAEFHTDGPNLTVVGMTQMSFLVDVLKATLETTDGAYIPRHLSPKLGMLLPISAFHINPRLGILSRRRVRPPV